MIVDGKGQGLLGMLLPHTMLIQLGFDLSGFGKIDLSSVLLILRCQFLIQNIFADDDATVANVDSRPLNELSDLGMRFAAKTAQRQIAWSSHALVVKN